MPCTADVESIVALYLPAVAGLVPEAKTPQRHALVQQLQAGARAQVRGMPTGLLAGTECTVPKRNRSQNHQYRGQCFQETSG